MGSTSLGALPPYAFAVFTLLQSSWAPSPYGLPQQFAFGSTGFCTRFKSGSRKNRGSFKNRAVNSRKWNSDLAAVAIIWDNLDTFLLALLKVSMTGMHEDRRRRQANLLISGRSKAPPKRPTATPPSLLSTFRQASTSLPSSSLL
jgi:hypothetical protein